MSPSARPNIALERTGHTIGFLPGTGVGGVWPAAHRRRSASEAQGVDTLTALRDEASCIREHKKGDYL